jgi:hypothetical protein
MKLHYTFLVLSIVLSIINQLDIYTSKTAERDSHLHTCKLTQTTGHKSLDILGWFVYIRFEVADHVIDCMAVM